MRITELYTPSTDWHQFTHEEVFLNLDHAFRRRYKNPFQQPAAQTHNPKVAGTNPAQLQEIEVDRTAAR